MENPMEIKRIFDLLDWMVRFYPREDALACKHNGAWQRYSSADFYKYAHLLAYGLHDLGVRRGDKVLTVANSRPEWNFLDMAVAMLGAVHVPVYPTLNADQYVQIFTHSEAKYLFVGNAAILRRVQPALEKMETPPLLFTIDVISGHRNLSELIRVGIAKKEVLESVVEEIKTSIQADDLFTLVYTSGTTGDSKGVMLSHRNLIFNFIGHAHAQNINEHSRALSFLPLNHIFERSMVYEYLYLGAGVYYAESVTAVQSNMAEIHGDGFCVVPRVLEVIYGKLVGAAHDMPSFARRLYQAAIDHGSRFDWQRQSIFFKLMHPLYDYLVYSKWRQKFGGHRLTIVSGGSALQPRIVRLFSAAGLCVYEGYGMTETSPVIAVNSPHTNDVKIGTVGPVMEGVEVRFSDEGEILTRGPHVMLGYYKDEAYTREVIDADGWLHTGDIGEWVDDHFLKITDRKKEIFKLSAGKYIAPQLIENKLKESNFIEQVMVIGENEKFASALILPNFQTLQAWAAKNRIECGGYDELIHDDRVYDLFRGIVDDFNKHLAPHENIKRFRLVSDEWSQQNNFLSPTLKLKRAVLYKYYADVIDEIYGKNRKPDDQPSGLLRQNVSDIAFDAIPETPFRFSFPSILSKSEERRKAREKKRRERIIAREKRRSQRRLKKEHRLAEKQLRREAKQARRQARKAERMARKAAKK